MAVLIFYNLTKDNLLTPDLSTPDPLDRIAVGKQRSRGIELDISGQLTQELSLIGSYAYTDAKVVWDNSGLQGNLMPLVPEHAGSAWLRYEVRRIPQLHGLSVGIGVFAAGKREGDIQNTFQLPGYARLDAFAAYRMRLGPTRLTAQINARNILNKRYYESTDPDSNVAPPVRRVSQCSIDHPRLAASRILSLGNSTGWAGCHPVRVMTSARSFVLFWRMK